MEVCIISLAILQAFKVDCTFFLVTSIVKYMQNPNWQWS